MSTVQRISKNAAALFVAHLITALLSLILSVLIARSLGDIEFGKYSFAQAFTAIFAVFLDLGLNRVIVRDISRDRTVASKYLGNIAIIKIVLSIVVLGSIALIVSLLHYEQDTVKIVLTFGGYIILVALGDIFRATFRGFERMEYEASISIIRQLVATSLGVSMILTGHGVVHVAFAFFVAGIVYFVASYVICVQKFAKPKFEIDLHFVKSTLKIALPLSLLSVATIIYIRTDTVMLSMMKGEQTVGWYNAAYNLVLALQPIALLSMGAVFPMMAKCYISSPNTLKVTLTRSVTYLSSLGIPLTVGTLMLSSRVIMLLYGDQFAHSITILKILSCDILIFFLHTALSNVLIAIHRHRQIAIVAGMCALLNVILNLVLIPNLAQIGAAIATIITEAVVLFASFWLVTKHFYRLPLERILFKPLIACIPMAVFLHLCSAINLAILIVVAMMVYFIALYCIGGIDLSRTKMSKWLSS